MQAYADTLRESGKTIAFVPTMGFFHEGHLTLMRRARELSDEIVVSIFVNPLQFSPTEDLAAYPRDTESDLTLAEKEGVNTVFMPDVDSLYPEGFQTHVTLDRLPRHLCGISRPELFKGVATIVSKLFNIVKPHVAVFGEKDFQQLQIIRQMVLDLSFDVAIESVPTARESDGLAMSSRNSYLSTSQREKALSIYQSLRNARCLIEKGVRDTATIVDEAKNIILGKPGNAIDYIDICDVQTLVKVGVIEKPVLMAVAAFVGKVRLIDNLVLVPDKQK
jgi:pantoate--beta-alanine ligase